MEILTILCAPIGENAYVAYSEDRSDCLVIDPGEYEPVFRVLRSKRLSPSAILLTHGHFDHIAGASGIRDTFGAPIMIGRKDSDKLSDSRKNLSALSFPGMTVPSFEADLLLDGGETLSYAGFNIEVIPTPGHSAGGLSFLIRDRKALFSGDTLFQGSFGRFDFPDSSFHELKESLVTKLFALEGDIAVYPGHGDSTTLQREKNSNPILFYEDFDR